MGVAHTLPGPDAMDVHHLAGQPEALLQPFRCDAGIRKHGLHHRHGQLLDPAIPVQSTNSPDSRTTRRHDVGGTNLNLGHVTDVR